MKRPDWRCWTGHIVLAAWTLSLLWRTDLVASAILGLIALNLSLAIPRFAGRRFGVHLFRPAIFVAWVASAMTALGLVDYWVGAALLLNFSAVCYAIGPVVICASICLVTRCEEPSGPARWEPLAWSWLMAAEVLWLAIGYCQNNGVIFYAALLAWVVTLLRAKRQFRLRAFAVQLVNTIIVLLVCLPIADRVLRFHSNARTNPAAAGGWDPEIKITAQNARRFYSYEESQGDSAAFALWWHYSCLYYLRLTEKIYDVNPTNHLDYRIRPNTRGMLMDCPVSINSRGFRGREIAAPKGAVYRIVAIGESTTFGMTYFKDDKPWPELLEQMIRERLKPSRPVEVVNAGVPGNDLSTNLLRLTRDILPLQPDMIISYHGFNGFRLIDSSLPPIVGPAPPAYAPRPLKLAADVEYRIKTLLELRRYRLLNSDRHSGSTSPLQTRYAAAYRQLIDFASTNHIRLALANYCMAANENSDPRVIDFYRAIGPAILYADAKANAIHSQIVRQLAAQNPEIIGIDTHPGLDGDPGKFVDLIHFTQDGRRQLAENIFAAILPRLQEDFGTTR